MSDNKYIPRTFQTPNAHVDELMHLLSGNEFKLLIFATRHILGWQDKISSRKANISLSMFEKGFTTKDGTHYNGCGLAKGTIISNLAPLAKFNILIPVGKATNAGQKYELTTNPDINGLTERHNESKTSKQKQTAKARKINKNNTGGQLNSTSTVEQTTGSTVEQTGGGQLNSTESNPLSNTKKQKLQSEDCGTIPFDSKPSQKQMFGHILILFNYDVGKLTKTLKSTIGKVAKELREADYLLEDVTGIYNHVDSKDFSGGFTPSALLKYASEWHSQQPAQLEPKPAPRPPLALPPRSIIEKWVGKGKTRRDMVNLMVVGGISETKSNEYLDECGVTA